MKFSNLTLLIFGLFMNAQTITSPDKNFVLNFSLNAEGSPTYALIYKNTEVIKPSVLGLETTKNRLKDYFEITSKSTSTFNETWKPVLGEYSHINNHYNELKIELQQKTSLIKLNLIFRLYNEGLAFRYEIPTQETINYFELTDEFSAFNLTSNHSSFWIPGDYDSNEYVYNQTKLSEINTEKIDLNNGVGIKNIGGKYVVQSPFLMHTEQKIYINIFEAAVNNYPVMHLEVNPTTYSVASHLVPNAVGSKAFLKTPFQSPWRTVIVNDDARKIVEANKMILNLNEPCKLNDTSWIKPTKYVGIWWEMHVGKTNWDFYKKENGKLIPHHKHGASTENAKKYINFAKKHQFDAVLIEGWNVGWEDWYGNWKEDVFDFQTPYPDFDLKEVSDYAKTQNIQLIMHHETSGSASNYERHLDRAINLMNKNGYQSVKTGYVGKIIPRGEHHDGQSMVNHYHHVVKRMSENQVMVNSHESSRPTGMHRTYPNYISAEAARGNEFNAWSSGNPPNHETILPFTRLLGGPMDYTPGIFDIKLNKFRSNANFKIHTTLAKQLALFVTMYSPIQMAADLPENYEKHLDAFQFIKDVPVDFDDTQVLEAKPGEYLTMVRKQKNKDNWFLGAITNENSRQTELKLNFLTKGKIYNATIYEDAKDADWKKNPTAYSIKKLEVNSNSKIKLQLANGGGTAISFIEK